MTEVIASIDAEIANLQQARALLSGNDVVKKAGRGRPKGSKNSVAAPLASAVEVASKGKRKLSPEGRKAIAEAMKRRWAERRKQVSK